jgi:hypothetical protein
MTEVRSAREVLAPLDPPTPTTNRRWDFLDAAAKLRQRGVRRSRGSVAVERTLGYEMKRRQAPTMRVMPPAQVKAV